MPNSDTCITCGKKFTGLFKADRLCPESIRDFAAYGEDVSNMCHECAVKVFVRIDQEKQAKLAKAKEVLRWATEKAMQSVEVSTLQVPAEWKAESKGIVSGYSVIGTGVFTEIASAWTDFFGEESGAYFEKIRTGEKRAVDMAKLEALRLGANAVCGATLTVTEATKGNGMLIISCVGTAIKCGEIPSEFEMLEKTQKELRKLENLPAIIVKTNSGDYERYRGVTDQA